MEQTTLFAEPQIEREDRSDGSILLKSRDPLQDHPPTVIHSLREWARRDPDRPLIAEREGGTGDWKSATYGQADKAARSIGEALLGMGLGPEKPLLIISGNSIAHMLMMLGAQTAGIPVVPTSVAYSLQSKDHARIRQVVELTSPGAVFAEDGEAYGPALAATGGIPIITGINPPPGARTFDEMRDATATLAADEAFAGVGPDTVCKILLTSGSTGTPKGVLNTHGMWAADQQMMRQVWPFLSEEQPVIVDWLPWSHTFGGNHNVGMTITNGGTMYVDAGRPVPGLFEQTLKNLADVQPTICFNVPAGHAQMVPALEQDEELAKRVYARLRLVFNAGAAMPSNVRTRLEELGNRVAGRDVPVTGSWGLTETAPAVTSAHFHFEDARCIGVPLPGADVKLHPVEDAFEIRVRGPIVTPGYLNRPDLTEDAFDDEGYYCTGDAVEPAADDPNQGVLFRGRIAEDFKLMSGTFVRVGAVRTGLISQLPVIQDAVIAGEGRPHVAALAWLNMGEAERLLGRAPQMVDELIVDAELALHVAQGLARQAANAASRVARLALMAFPADLDSGEITDKGYVNQRKVLSQRKHLVDRLYADGSHEDPAVIKPED